MSRGKPVQEGVRVRLAEGTTWEKLGQMTPEEIRDKGLFPAGLPAAAAPEPSRRRHGLPEVPHRRDQEAGRPRPHAVRPRLRPARSLPARVPAAIFLTTRPDLGDVSQGKLVTHRQLLRAVQRHPEPQAARGAAAAASRRSRSSSSTRPTTAAARRPSRGVACFDCHVNGHTNGADPPGRRHPAAGVPPPHRHARRCAA